MEPAFSLSSRWPGISGDLRFTKANQLVALMRTLVMFHQLPGPTMWILMQLRTSSCMSPIGSPSDFSRPRPGGSRRMTA
jgi:hypothetical protein